MSFYTNGLTPCERFENDQTHLFIFFFQEAIIKVMNRSNYVYSELTTRRFLMIEDFAEELLTGIVFDQIVLVAMQTLFTNFNIPRHA